MLQTLRPKDIQSACGNSSYRRGEDYYTQDRVFRIKISELDKTHVSEGVRVLACTKGRERHQYKQEIILTRAKHAVDINGACTCPMHYNCKHVAAVCINLIQDAATMDTDHRSPDNIRLNAWFSNLTRVVNENRQHLPAPHQEFLIYLLKLRGKPDTGTGNIALIELEVEVRTTRFRKNGNGFVQGREVPMHELSYSAVTQQWNIQPIDREINDFLKALGPPMYAHGRTMLSGKMGSLALMRILQTDRCYWQTLDGVALRPAEARKLRLDWQQDERLGYYTLNVVLEKPAYFVLTEPPIYLDKLTGEIGMINSSDLTGAMLSVLMNAPPIPQNQATQFSQTLRREFPQLDLPTPIVIPVRHNDTQSPRPRLILQQQPDGNHHFPTLSMVFEYADDEVMPMPAEETTVISCDDEIVYIRRDLETETKAIQRLMTFGFQPLSNDSGVSGALILRTAADSESANAAIWAEFLERWVILLQAEGWHIDMAEDFTLAFIHADWTASINDLNPEDSGNNDWFELRFDLDIDGEQLPLIPLLTSILKADPDTLPPIITLPLEHGHRYLRLPIARILPFLTTLRELFDRLPPDENGSIRLSRCDALLIDDLEDQKKPIKGAKKLRELAAKLRNFDHIQPVPIPSGFTAELRHYQQAGLNWLQFLREYRFNGVLADDMGLGKTVQTLAHLMVEKQSGRLQQPALVIAPTSLMGNWWREVSHFAPGLNVLVLHGHERHTRFADIESSDLILSTYPLLLRDADIHKKQHYHYVVLDEAQAIKNPTTKMAKVVRNLNANHRLCLTGTPLENHLGELWSLYEFLMPGFLGDLKTFNRCYRVPIEKHGDVERRINLARRLQPFLLRRNKHEVANELPPKTEIIHTVELGKEQAQLYESIRVAMDKRVHEAIKNHGVSRSHITILDALLKLRQVCCDPRLVKLAQAQATRYSAKLEWLMELLPAQLEEGRRILLFSQFTSMLSLIEAELQQLNIRYSKLTGQTRKRDAAIQKFCKGDVNLFLISLKAGGTGLNLTEADTVIIYDPWWNPAVEMQAIDRAHRIGQDKPVFIYKLVTANSVEEKMLTMQAKKQTLAKGIYPETAGNAVPLLDADSLRELFAPLP